MDMIHKGKAIKISNELIPFVSDEIKSQRKIDEVDTHIIRLKNLLPDLIYSKETHRQWRDCDQKYRDENPDIGDSEFHAKYVDIYDERISAIEEIITFLQKEFL